MCHPQVRSVYLQVATVDQITCGDHFAPVWLPSEEEVPGRFLSVLGSGTTAAPGPRRAKLPSAALAGDIDPKNEEGLDAYTDSQKEE